MKNRIATIFLGACLCLPLAAQTSPVPHAANPASDVHFATPPHVARFTPPAPKAPLPPAEVIDRKQSRLASGGTLTLERINPPVFATPPAQPQRLPVDPALVAQFRATRIAWNKAHPRVFLDFSATVYDHQYTHLRWRHGEQHYQAWSNIDFTQLSGLGSFLLGNTTCDFHFIPLNQSTRPVVLPNGRIRPPQDLPDIPELPATPAFVITEGDDSNTEALAVIQALHDLWLKESAAITQFQQDREQCGKEREAWQKAHPPQPEDITVRFAPGPNTTAITSGGITP